MKLNQVLTETVEQFISTAKDTSTEWMKFAIENPLTQEVMSRYPDSLKKSTEFVDQQTKQFKTLLKMTGMPGFSEKKKPAGSTETESSSN
jgi:hypothetical protein